MKMKCEVIQDLLPLYYDEVCSDASKMIVEEHLEYCEACKKELEFIKEGFEVSPVQLEKKEIVKKASLNWKKTRDTSLLKGICMAVLFICFITIGYMGKHWCSTVEANDEIGLAQQATTYFDCEQLSIEQTTKINQYLIAVCQDGGNSRYVCVYENDDLFENRWYMTAGKKAEGNGEINYWQYETEDEKALVIFYGFELGGYGYSIRLDNTWLYHTKEENDILEGFYIDDTQKQLDIEVKKIEEDDVIIYWRK